MDEKTSPQGKSHFLLCLVISRTTMNLTDTRHSAFLSRWNSFVALLSRNIFLLCRRRTRKRRTRRRVSREAEREEEEKNLSLPSFFRSHFFLLRLLLLRRDEEQIDEYIWWNRQLTIRWVEKKFERRKRNTAREKEKERQGMSWRRCAHSFSLSNYVFLLLLSLYLPSAHRFFLFRRRRRCCSFGRSCAFVCFARSMMIKCLLRQVDHRTEFCQSPTIVRVRTHTDTYMHRRTHKTTIDLSYSCFSHTNKRDKGSSKRKQTCPKEMKTKTWRKTKMKKSSDGMSYYSFA